MQGGSRCPEHPHETTFASRARGTRHERGYGAEWDRLRPQILARDAYICQPHAAQGIFHTARIVDHKVNKAEGGTDDPSNLWSVCDEFHRAKTQAEAQRGRRARRR